MKGLSAYGVRRRCTSSQTGEFEPAATPRPLRVGARTTIGAASVLTVVLCIGACDSAPSAGTSARIPAGPVAPLPGTVTETAAGSRRAANGARTLLQSAFPIFRSSHEPNEASDLERAAFRVAGIPPEERLNARRVTQPVDMTDAASAGRLVVVSSTREACLVSVDAGPAASGNSACVEINRALEGDLVLVLPCYPAGPKSSFGLVVALQPVSQSSVGPWVRVRGGGKNKGGRLNGDSTAWFTGFAESDQSIQIGARRPIRVRQFVEFCNRT